MPLAAFHPAVARWFQQAFPAPTPAQAAAWPAIRARRDTLVAAPTGSGKTLTAFLAALDALVVRGLEEEGGLPNETAVLYVSPLKALSNDVRLNLEAPLAGIRAELAALGLPDVAIRTAVRTGDTPPRERQQSLRKPPHILVTTPESLYVLLGSASGRKMLATVRSVIVDEIHAVAASKRGSHLALSLERLQALCDIRPVRIGLSATQKPIDEVARFLVGAGALRADGSADCTVVDIGYAKQRDLALELPPAPLDAVMSNEQWTQVYARVAELVWLHKTTLVFVNTRRMAERAARHLGEILGKDAVAAHHGSLSKETRLDAEQRLKRGELRVLVATASLELGLDIGDVDLVCQLGSPRSIASFLQRAGRSGHAVGGVPKARLFPQSRDELVECAALLDCIRRGELDALRVLPAPLDVLAQQIVAETACREWHEDELFALVRRAWPYAQLTHARFMEVVRMVSEGFTTRQGQRAGYVHRDAVNHLLRERKGARMTALTSGGTIPETGDYTVMLEPQADKIGTVNEDFAVESLAGDVFQLGNTSYRILKIEPGRVRVEDAHGAAPNIPFWLGEAPGRSDALSFGVSRLREEVAQALVQGGREAAMALLTGATGLDEEAARQIVEHLAHAAAVLGTLPTQHTLVMERFFDASGGMQLVIHSPFGSRLNRAWGLALRKRFCRTFNFELQAAATEDAIVLSLATQHSFPLEEVARYLHSNSALDVLVQALLDAPLFGVRWRWNATTALALPRFSGGRKVAPQLQRMRSEDLLAAVFPDQVACAENLVGEREVPAHPLVAQTLDDCLHDAMDAEGWLALLRRLESGEVRLLARELPAPSPLAMEVLNARPYAFLDDAPLEERRTLAVQNRRYTEPESADDVGQLDAEAIASVREEAWPQPRGSDEMHEALGMLGAVGDHEVASRPEWKPWLAALAKAGRATRVRVEGQGRTARGLWVAAERLPLLQAIVPAAPMQPAIEAPADAERPEDREAALRELLRSRLGGLGPVTVAQLAQPLCLPLEQVEAALLALQTEGSVLQGRFTPGTPAVEWCERHLLARIHRYTLKRLRREIEPVEPRDFARFLFDWQHLGAASRVRGPEALSGVLSQLEGYEAPAPIWEAELLPARVADYAGAWLDDLCTAGRVLWTRLRPSSSEGRKGAGSLSLRATPVVLLPRRSAALWTGLAPAPVDDETLGSRAARVAAHLQQHGACFFDEIAADTRLLPVEIEEALTELVAKGRVRCDSYAGLRALLVPASKRASADTRRRRRVPLFGIEDAGRWTLVRPPSTSASANPGSAEAHEQVVHVLLRRYGVICWRLLEREAAWLPPWRELVRVCRRLEARGEIRGGRFIAGVTGEQFALPEAVAAMRQVRRTPGDGAFIVLAASDPANLLGTIVHGAKVPRVAGSRVLWRDGLPIATSIAGELAWLVPLDAAEAQAAQRALTPGSVADQTISVGV
ncbi:MULTISPECIES: DEAD/DEAH box helicase [unclassified Variovorax]|uniref:DEAD/DEAH box helicase n=1 Tax=unclassified Variovorax TaxID=663243 RepID=UPI002576317F|nr:MULTISPECIES: DEAD/DEAH box helicase [unclassified Variovorax]MDM0085973.1 DEAD/DEAH box helicase [Variovorax sp. J22G40]MDM0145770.1 DEAD/DEAH box helicase [Variovorax sp. J2P1-31]